MSFYFKVICNFKSNNKIVITFDDGPDEVVTPKVLEILRKHNVKAAFFCIGSKVEQFPKLVKQAYDEGHVIANHSYCHKNMYGFYSTKKIIADISKCNVVIKNILGVTPKFFRPPFGVTNPNLKRALRKYPLITIGWSLRTFDTMNSNSVMLMKRLLKTKPGDIILFHDNIDNIEKVLDEYLIFCKQHQLRIAPINEMLTMQAYE